MVRCAAGVRLPKLVAWCAARGLSGLEGMAGIPGAVGGAVAMNAGSYGVSMGDVLTRARLWSADSGAVWLTREALTCGYRHFDPGLSAPWLVLGCELRLTRTEPDIVREAIKANLQRKKATQPITQATAGCVFKNPEGVSAGKLLDEAGFKGRRMGGVGFSELHANFLVHHGGGSATQALELLETARETVRERTGIRLELEVKVVG